MKITATFPKRKDGSFGRVFDPKAGPKGTHYVIGNDGVVDVPDDFAETLINIGNFTGDAPKKPAQSNTDGDDKNDPQKMLITNGEETIDLMAMDKDALLALGRDTMGLNVDGRNNEQTIRAAIYDHVNG